MPDAKKPYCQVNQILKTRVRQEGKSSLYYEPIIVYWPFPRPYNRKIQVLSALSRSYSKRLHTNNNSSKVFLFRIWKCGSVVQKRWERNGHLGDLGECCKSVPFLQKSSTRYFLWEIHKSLLSWLIAPKVLLESLWPTKTIRPISSIPDICHERHIYIRVNFFWPV